MTPDCLKLYAVTDRTWLGERTLLQVCEELLDGGVSILQLREKHLSREAFLQEGLQLRELCRRRGIPLIINDEVSIAKELGVGVHVGQSDLELREARKMLGPGAIIGVSCQTVSQALEAEANGADYLGVGAVFPTSTKLDADAVDARELSAICAAVRIPVVAIGGISMQNLRQLDGSGIAGVAVVSALFAAAAPRQAAVEMMEAVKEMLAVPVPRIPGAIMDMDGTILDTLSYWERLPLDYLASKGKTPEPGLLRKLASMEVPVAAHYLKETYGLQETPEDIRREIFQAVRYVYYDKAGLMPGARELLERLRREGTRIALFTASEPDCADAAMRRNGVREFFDCIISTEEAGVSKDNPKAFLHVLGRLGTPLDMTTVYEDADYAIAGARQAGLRVVTPE